MEEKYYISKKCDVLVKNERVILYNIYTGETVKLSKECWNIINENLKNGYSVSEICNAMEEDCDRDYFLKLFDVLIKMKLVTSKNEIQEKEQIENIDFAITHRCNLHCIHCCVDASFIDDKDLLSTEDIFEISDKLIKVNPKIIVITGGEPMIRKDFMKIVSYIKKRYTGKLILMTNGLLINEKNVATLVEYFDYFNISIDGYDEESCSKIRGKGVFNNVIKNIELIKKSGFNSKHISLSMVKTSINSSGINLFFELNDKLGTQSVVRVFNPIGRGKDNSDILMGKELIESNEAEFEKPKRLPRAQTCAAGSRKLAINYDGSIYPCMLLDMSDYKIGNIMEIVLPPSQPDFCLT